MRSLTVYYDERCALCRRARAWLEREPAFVALRFVPRGAAAPALGRALPRLGDELVVVADDGRVWIGNAAFIVCLWALRRWRGWSERLSRPWLAPFAARFFDWVSRERRELGRLLAHEPCADDRCAHGHAAPGRPPYR
jgi:predicted DCC family thiol-disulfide oxidoreductase YuxK